MNDMQKTMEDDKVLYGGACTCASNETTKTSGYDDRSQKYKGLSSKVTPVALDPRATLFAIASGTHSESRPLRLTRTNDLRGRKLKRRG